MLVSPAELPMFFTVTGKLSSSPGRMVTVSGADVMLRYGDAAAVIGTTVRTIANSKIGIMRINYHYSWGFKSFVILFWGSCSGSAEAVAPAKG